MQLRHIILMGVLTSSLPATAAVSPQEASKIGAELTAVGAEKAGNADNTIPAWEGGIQQPPSKYKKGKTHKDPYAGDKPLFTITAQNLAKYKDKLTRGQVELFKIYKNTYKMPVYATRRSASFPDFIYNETKKNATRAKLDNNGNGVQGTSAGFPFPMPQHGHEVMWNHMLRYVGSGVSQFSNTATTQTNGDFTLGKTKTEIKFYYNNPKISAKKLKNRFAKILVRVLSPPKEAGVGYMLHVPLDRVKGDTKVWTYNPGVRRVKKFENIGYDGTVNDGLMTHDQIDMFNGPVDRYSFDIVGKKEVYLPYNAYKLQSSKVKYKDIVHKGHPNPELTRYELRRVWIVEANIRPKFKHLYNKRVFYFDEDSWNIIAQDIYDERKDFWRYAESHTINYYDMPTVLPITSVHYDLKSRRYVINGMTNQEDPPDFNFTQKDKYFKPANLKRLLAK